MIVPVNDDYRIASDEHSWMVQRIKRYGPDTKRAQEGITEQWQTQTWHPSLPSAGKSLVDRLWRECEAGEGETISQALARINQAVYAAVTASEAWKA